LRLESAVLKPTAAVVLAGAVLALLLGAPVTAAIGVVLWYLICRVGKALDPCAGLLAYAFLVRKGGSLLAPDRDIGHDEAFLLARAVMQFALALSLSFATLGYVLGRGLSTAILVGVCCGLLFGAVATVVAIGPDVVRKRRVKGQ